MLYKIEHITELVYSSPVREHQVELRLTPRDNELQRRISIHIETEPAAELHTYIDCFGNNVHYFSVTPPHTTLVTTMRAEVETTLSNPFDFPPIHPAREKDWVKQAAAENPRLLDFILHTSPATPDLTKSPIWPTVPVYDGTKPLIEIMQELMRFIAETLRYDPDATSVHSSLENAFAQKAGVCQDYAHFMISVVRAWGFPARYVMGYQDPGYAQAGDQPREQATHAWAEVMIPGAGWRGFDATHQLVANDTYIAVACGRDYLDAAPQRGAYKGDDGGEQPRVKISVEPVSGQSQRQSQF